MLPALSPKSKRPLPRTQDAFRKDPSHFWPLRDSAATFTAHHSTLILPPCCFAFSGPTPKTLGKLSELKELGLSNNMLDGEERPAFVLLLLLFTEPIFVSRIKYAAKRRQPLPFFNPSKEGERALCICGPVPTRCSDPNLISAILPFFSTRARPKSTD